MPHLLLERGVIDRQHGGINSPCRVVRKKVRRRDTPPLVVVGSDVASDISKPEAIPALNLDFPL